MNTIIQNILVFASVALAIGFLLNKFSVLPKKKKPISKQCGKDDCGCH